MLVFVWHHNSLTFYCFELYLNALGHLLLISPSQTPSLLIGGNNILQQRRRLLLLTMVVSTSPSLKTCTSSWATALRRRCLVNLYWRPMRLQCLHPPALLFLHCPSSGSTAKARLIGQPRYWLTKMLRLGTSSYDPVASLLIAMTVEQVIRCVGHLSYGIGTHMKNLPSTSHAKPHVSTPC